MNAKGTNAGCPVALATVTTRSAWAPCVRESIEVELRSGQVDSGVESQSELVVGEPVDEFSGVSAVALGL